MGRPSTNPVLKIKCNLMSCSRIFETKIKTQKFCSRHCLIESKKWKIYRLNKKDKFSAVCKNCELNIFESYVKNFCPRCKQILDNIK